MTLDKITELANQAGITFISKSGVASATEDWLRSFAELVRNATLDEAKEVCRQVVRDTNTTLTWEGCTEIQEALEREKT